MKIITATDLGFPGNRAFESLAAELNQRGNKVLTDYLVESSLELKSDLDELMLLPSKRLRYLCIGALVHSFKRHQWLMVRGKESLIISCNMSILDLFRERVEGEPCTKPGV